MSAHRLGALALALLAGFLEVTPELHLAEDALALQLLLQRTEGLVDVVVADGNLHLGTGSFPAVDEQSNVFAKKTAAATASTESAVRTAKKQAVPEPAALWWPAADVGAFYTKTVCRATLLLQPAVTPAMRENAGFSSKKK